MKPFFLFILLIPFLVFTQTQIGLDIDGEATGDHSGHAVSLSNNGNFVAIGAYNNDGGINTNSGHVRVYENQSGSWVQIGGDIDGEAALDGSGWSVSLSDDGSIVAIGAIGNDDNGSNSGHVRIYENQSGNWVQIGGDIDGEAIDDGSGYELTLSGNGSIVAIGANGNDDNGDLSGHVRVYENQSGSWVQIGSDINGEAAGDNSGVSIALSGDGSIIAIGALGNDDIALNSGHVRVYENQSGTWTQVGTDIDGVAFVDQSGYSVSLSYSGTVVAVGAIGNDDNGTDSGHVRVYENQTGSWIQIGADIDGEAAGDSSGFRVSLSNSGDLIAIGAPSNSGNGSFSGHVRIYQNQSGTWAQIGTDIDGEFSNDLSGSSVSLSSDGNTVAIGAVDNNGNGSNSGHVRVYDLSTVLSNDSFVLSEFNLYPNPVKEQFTVQLSQGLELQKINMYNSLGQFINSTKKNVVSTINLSQGFYFIEVVTNQGKATKKIVIK